MGQVYGRMAARVGMLCTPYVGRSRGVRHEHVVRQTGFGSLYGEQCQRDTPAWPVAPVPPVFPVRPARKGRCRVCANLCHNTH